MVFHFVHTDVCFVKLSLNKGSLLDCCAMTFVSGNDTYISFNLRIFQKMIGINSNNEIKLFVAFIIR